MTLNAQTYKTQKTVQLKRECLWYVLQELFRAIEMFMEQIDFGMKRWDIEDPETGKHEIYVEEKNILRKMYKLKHIYEKQRKPQPNSNN